MRNIGYFWERGYPYLFGIIISFLCSIYSFDMRTNSNYEEMLNGLVTLGSIIIGFLGAILPTVLAMKNESKLIKYVFEHDKENLFSKYLKATISLGLLDVLISLIMYVRESFPVKGRDAVYYLWIFITISFIIATYRSLSHMITLIFSKENECAGENEVRVSEERTNAIKNKYKV